MKNVRGPKNFTADVWVGYPIEEDISYDMVCVVDVFPTLTYCGEGTSFCFPTYPCCKCAERFVSFPDVVAVALCVGHQLQLGLLRESAWHQAGRVKWWTWHVGWL